MARKMLTGADLSGQKVINLADGSAASDAATFGQLAAAIRGLVWKPEVKAASTANLTLSGAQTVDGISLSAGDRVLVKDQSTQTANGIYVVAAGAWSRATDLDEGTEFTNGVAVSVEQGTVNGDKVFVMSNDGTVTIGSTNITFVLLGGSGASYTAGNGLDLSGNTFSVEPKSGGGVVVDGDGVSIDPAFSGLAKRFAQNVPAGSASAAITHNLGTLDVIVAVYEVSGGVEVECDVVLTSTTVVTLGFASAPTTNQFRVVVIG